MKFEIVSVDTDKGEVTFSSKEGNGISSTVICVERWFETNPDGSNGKLSPSVQFWPPGIPVDEDTGFIWSDKQWSNEHCEDMEGHPAQWNENYWKLVDLGLGLLDDLEGKVVEV